MPKIAYVITDSNIGGAGQHLIALINNLSPHFVPEVILPINSRLTPLLLDLGVGVVCHEVEHIAEQSFSWAGMRAIGQVLKKIKPDIVHTHSSFSGRMAAKFYTRAKIIHTVNSAFPVPARRKKFPLKQFYGFINNSFSHRVIIVSPVLKKMLTQAGVKSKKIRQVFNGVPRARQYNPGELEVIRNKYNVPKDHFTVTYLARLVDIKGHDYVLDMAREMPYNVTILIAGDGEYREHLEARIAEEGIHNAMMLGFVSNIDELLAITDVQINASYVSEATSLALLSGMSVGVPAVATLIGGNPYVIKQNENGIIVPPQDVEALDNAITRLKDDKTFYMELSKGAYKIYEKQFTDVKMTQDTEQIYMELLK